MKKLLATLCIAGSAFTLSACETVGMGDIDTAPPYATERTAGYSSEPAPMKKKSPAPVERVFREVQTK